MAPTPPILIAGIGNILQRDDGIGPHAAQALLTLPLPSCVEVLDAGTIGPGLLAYLDKRQRLLVLDSIDAGGPPGQIYRFRLEQVQQMASAKLSQHETGVLETLRLAERLGKRPPDVTIFGVQPLDVSLGMELTPAVASALPRLVDIVYQDVVELRSGSNVTCVPASARQDMAHRS